MMLSNRRTTKAQIGPRGSAPLLFAPRPRRQVFSHQGPYENTKHHYMAFFCLDGLSVQRSKSKFLGTQHTYTSLNAHRLKAGDLGRMHSHHARIQGFLSGEGGCPGPTARKQPGQRFLVVLNLFYSLQRGSYGFITETTILFKGSRVSNFSKGGGGGVQGPSVDFYRNPYNL